MKSFELECKRVLLGRLEKGDDVLEGSKRGRTSAHVLLGPGP